MENIKTFFLRTGDKVGDIFGADGTVGLIILAAAAVVFIAAIAAIVVGCVKSKKRKSQTKTEEVVVRDDAYCATVVLDGGEPVGEPEAACAEGEGSGEAVTSNQTKAQKNVDKSKKASKSVDKKPPKKLLGKWVVEKKSKKEYIAVLLASNGEVMLTSEPYSTEQGARGGIETIKKGVETGNFVIYRDKSGEYYFKLKSASNRLLCAGEIYKTRERCVSAAESVKRLARDAVSVSGLVEGKEYVDYVPATDVTYEAKKGVRGKWAIENGENGFSARLYANNGQLMLATEEVAVRRNAVKAIDAVTKSAASGNFVIDKDKFGRFYYKLRNSQNSVICIGEAYDTLDNCISALESVRRFAASAPLPEDLK